MNIPHKNNKWGLDYLQINQDRIKNISHSFYNARPENRYLSVRE